MFEAGTPPGFATNQLLVVPLNKSLRGSSRTDPGAIQQFYDEAIAEATRAARRRGCDLHVERAHRRHWRDVGDQHRHRL